jgi:signal transduction histidine kinase/ligand-binding sensor domain-containing protein
VFLRRTIFILFPVLFCLTAFTQKHNFISYNIDEGLPQSSVLNILQDNDRHIWMATGGGVSRYDGRSFTNYTADEGLSESNIMEVAIGRDERIWAVTLSGLNSISNGKITVYPFPQNIRNPRASLVIDNTGKLWALVNNIVYSLTNNQLVKEELKGVINHDLSLFFKDKNNDLYLLDSKKQVFKFQQGSWKHFVSLRQLDSTTRIHQIYIDTLQNLWVLTPKNIFVKRSTTDSLVSYFSANISEVNFWRLNFDQHENLWIGCNKGAFKVKPDRSSIYFNYQNGFTDNWVHQVFPDVEGNIWLATEGSGLFKYTGGTFTSFDNSSGYFPSGVFAVARYDQNRILLGGGGDECFIYDGKQFVYPLRNTPLKFSRYIYSAYVTTNGTAWIGTIGYGLWKYQNGAATRHEPTVNSVFGTYGEDDRILFATNRGLLVYENNAFRKLDGIDQAVRTVIALNNDSILAGTATRLFLFKNYQFEDIFPDNFSKTTIAAFEKKNNKVFIGTLGGGIYVWDRASNSFSRLTRKNGLNSDFIYSLRFDQKGQLWAGTGKGVSRIISTDDFATVTIRNYGKEQGFTGLECNQNAIAVMDDNSIWFGAVKGAYCYHPDEDKETTVAPKLVLQSVKLFSKPLFPGTYSDSMSQSSFYPVPGNLVLSSRNNHVTFEFNAITYRNSQVRFSYFLKGLEKDYSIPDQTNFVVYPSLPPGSYTFNVKLFDEADNELSEHIEYKFVIEPAFYQTIWFKILTVALVLALGILFYTLRQRYRQKQKKLIQRLRLEEQNKIRVKTAQDFHDEMGNKLARITVLSDILKSKLPAHEEAQTIAKKIQDNASLLYQGTKDIIWSLNPKNDNLYNLLMHVNDFAVDLFHDTEIEFENVRINKDLSRYFLPMDYARNVMMICKEALTNILKHSQATKANLDAGLVAGHMIRVVISDNGRGFSEEVVDYGNGLHNIRQRADNLKGKVEVDSDAGTGTQIILTIAIPTNGAIREADK